MLTTWLTDRFDLSVPVVGAPMGGVSEGRLAAAVSAAGALGMVGYTGSDPEWLREQAAVAATGGRPFGIGLLAWSLPRAPGLLDVAIESGPALVSVSYGDYRPAIARLKEAGIATAVQAGTVADAVAAAHAGVDVVVARGGEAGGHGRNSVGTLPLLQAVLDAVDVPVLAAGGIGTAGGVAAVLAAGAVGAWVGTAFLACTEAAGSDDTKQTVLGAAETDTVYTTVLDLGRGVPWPEEYGGRAVRNAFADTWHGRADELRAAGVRSQERVAWAGQGVGLVRAVRPAAEVVADLARAEDLLRAAAARSR